MVQEEKNSKVSVVIPFYNQPKTIKYVLEGFVRQRLEKNMFELIIVDDGSTSSIENEIVIYQEYIFIKYIKIQHSGSAKARNIGVINSSHELIVFCDADRIPDENFLLEHIKMHRKKDIICIGAARDYFTKFSSYDKFLSNRNQRSRLSRSYKELYSLINDNDFTCPWLGFLVGNASLEKEIFCSVDGFDEELSEWGFEHIELGYRIHKELKYKFVFVENAYNYHIPHKRERMISNRQYRKLYTMHPEINWKSIGDYFELKINLQEMQQQIKEQREVD